jgi:LmbE family N-acetylglucosaminyl deacetylase
MMRRRFKKEPAPQPLLKRLFRSALRVVTLTVVVLGGAYAWNPQKLHYPRRKPPVPNPRIDPESKRLFSAGTRLTVVTGHPDDTEYYISGTLLKLAQAGVKITLIVTTDGDKSFYPPFTTNVEENRRVRRKEQAEAAKAYGASVVMLGGSDGRYDPDEPTLRAKLRDAMIASQPDYVMTFESEYLPTVQHRDHENSGRAASELAKETGAKWLVRFATTADNYYVDTSGTWARREELLAIHASQFYGEKLVRIQGFVMSKAVEDGAEINAETAEGFRVSRLR